MLQNAQTADHDGVLQQSLAAQCLCFRLVAHGYLHLSRDFVRVKHLSDVVRGCWNCSDAL